MYTLKRTKGMAIMKIQENKTSGGWKFDVEIIDQDSKTNHTITMSEDFYNSLNTVVSPKEVVEESFNFLLKRESKEQILSTFDITLISKYFPEYIQYVKNP